MSDGIYVALSGAVAQMSTLDVTATNLANASTDGYQRLRPVFREVLAQAQGASTYRPTTLATTELDTTRGPTRVTGRPLDVALGQNSYLAVSTGQGERYTRACSLRADLQGAITTTKGDPIASEDGRPLRLDPTNPTAPTITASGELWQGESFLGRLKTVTFPKPNQLTPEGGTLLAASDAAGAPTMSKEPLEIGTLEESNASVMSGMTELVAANRSFEALQKAISTFEEADQKVTTTVPNADE